MQPRNNKAAPQTAKKPADQPVTNLQNRAQSVSDGLLKLLKALTITTLLTLTLTAKDWQAPQTALPPALRNIGIDQKLGQTIPVNLPFTDEAGRSVHLSEYFGQKPVLLVLVYYQCPMLCSQILQGVMHALRVVPFEVGKEFDVVVVSFDTKDTPELALAKKKLIVERYGKRGDPAGWHFLTGSESSIQALTKAVGFRYQWDQESQTFIHASGIMVLTPEARLARYFYGIEFPPKDLRLAFVEASKNKIGSPVDQLLLYCFHYDPSSGKYGLMIFNILRAAGAMTVFGVLGLILILRRREQVIGHAQEPSHS
jgi:protein SCO1/2